MYEVNQAHFIEGALGTKPDKRFPLPSRQRVEEETLSEQVAPTKKSLLTQVFPDPGYFAAGGLAGVISRTATAPLDRLKVYLIAHTGPVVGSLDVARKGNVGEVT